jgi:hypothetical protein
MRLRVLLPASLLVACEVQAIGFSSWEFLDEAQRIRTSEDTNQHFELSVREHPLRYFIEPVVVALNWAEEVYGYSRRIMVGLSGGGWTTVVVSGIDTRIDAGVQNPNDCGGLPTDPRDLRKTPRFAQAARPVRGVQKRRLSSQTTATRSNADSSRKSASHK